MKFSTRIGVVLCALLLISRVVLAQEEDRVKAEMFRQLNAVFEQARNEEVPLLAPKLFREASKLYERAEKDYDNGEKVKKIRQRIDEALQAINNAIEAAKVSRVALADLLMARKEATTKREYFDLVPAELAKAERIYQEAISKAEEGKINEAKNKAEDAIKAYRQMMIKALLEGPIKNAEAQLKDARKKMSKDEHKKARRELERLKKSVENAKKDEFAIAEYDAKILTQIAQIIPTGKSPAVSKSRAETPDAAPSPSPVQTRPGEIEVNADNPIRVKFTALGGSKSMLGSATSQIRNTPDGIGRYQHFQNGSIYWSSQTGAHVVVGEIREKWLSIGAENGVLGYPISDEEVTADGAKVTRFQHGLIRWTQERGVRIELNVVTLPRRTMMR